MDTSIPTNQDAIFAARLRQAVRVVAAVPEMPNTVFDMTVFAVREGNTLRACIAGLCGLDPWFQAEGLTTIFEGYGRMSVGLFEFFGTEAPFYPSNYLPEFFDRDITVQAAIAALNKAIAKFEPRPLDPEQATA